MVEQLIKSLLEISKVIGLDEADFNHVKEFIENREYGLAFDMIVTQLYEYEIEIYNDFYFLLVKVAQRIGVPENDYIFMKELIKTETKYSERNKR